MSPEPIEREDTRPKPSRAGLWIGLFAVAVILMAAIGMQQSIEIVQGKEKGDERRLAAANSLERMAATAEENAKVLREVTGVTSDRSSSGPQATPSARSLSSPSMSVLMEELSRFLATMGKELQEYQTGYAKRLGALQLENVLSGKSLATASGRSKSRATMQLFGSYVDDAVEFDRKRADRMNTWLAQHMKNLSPSEAKGFRDGFDKGHAKNSARAADFYKVQREFVATVLQILDAVDKAAGGVQLAADGQLLFADGAALARFNQLMSSVQALAVREETLQKEMVASQEETARNLRGLSKSMKR